MELLHVQGWLSRQECQRCLRKTSSSEWKTAQVVNNGAHSVDTGHRCTGLQWLPVTERWFEPRLWRVSDAAGSLFGVELGISDSWQVARYLPGQFFGAHIDNGDAKIKNRIVSVVVLLSGSRTVTFPNLRSPLMRPGDLVAFRSELMHQVLPCDRPRYSMTAWLPAGREEKNGNRTHSHAD